MKIAKKVFSSKTEKNLNKNTPQAKTSNTISSSVELKMERTPFTNVRPKINRNVVNTQLTREMEIEVPWTGALGEMETFIMADRHPNGEQIHDVYILQANKV